MWITANRWRALGLRSHPGAFGLLALAAALLIGSTLFRSAQSHQAPPGHASDTGQQPNRFGGHAAEGDGHAGRYKSKYPPIALPSSPQKGHGPGGGQPPVAAAAVASWGPAPVFNDNPLVVGLTIVQARHVTELRDVINSTRINLGAAAYQWQAPAAVGARVTAFTIAEMRVALDEVLGAPAGGYSAGLDAGHPIKAIHIQELRDRVLGAWQGGPPAPSNLAAVAPSATQVNLSWADNSTNETGFQIERTTPGGAAYATLATAGSGTTSWSDTGLTPGVTYLYRVRAETGSEHSAYSNEAGATTYTPGSYCLSLDGVDGHVSVPNSPTLNPNGPITVEAWIKTNSSAQQGIVERFGSAGSEGGFALRLEQGRLRFYTLRNSATYDFVEGSTPVTAGVWHHVAGVFDGSQLRVYLDGKADGLKGTTVAPGPGTQSLKIGARGNDGAFSFSGLIDEVRVSAGVEYAGDFTAMSIREVASAFANLNDGPRAVWLFDDGTANDASGRNNNGTLIGGALLSAESFGASNIKYENLLHGTSADTKVSIGFNGLDGQKVSNQYQEAGFCAINSGFNVACSQQAVGPYYTYATTLAPAYESSGPRLTRGTQFDIDTQQTSTSGRFRNFRVEFPKLASNIKFQGIGVLLNSGIPEGEEDEEGCGWVAQINIYRSDSPTPGQPEIFGLCGRPLGAPTDKPVLYDLNKMGAKNVTAIEIHTILDISGIDFDTFEFTVPPPPEVKSVVFEALSNGGSIDRHPTDPLFGCQDKCGQRIFADKNTPGDTADRSKVRVKAITTYPEGTKIYFKSFDLDDPSSNDPDVDQTGSQGFDNRGGPTLTGTLSAGFGTTDASGIATVEFEVKKQPGNNYMVAASADSPYLNGIVEEGIGLKDQGGSVLPTLKAKATEMLTVWRRVHIEVDSMGEATGNKFVATVEGLVGEAGQASASLLPPNDPLCVEETLENNRFEGGRLVIGTSSYQILANDDSCLTVAAGPDFQRPAAGTKVTLYDDDDLDNNDAVTLNGDEGEDIPMPSLSKLQGGSAGDSPANNLFAAAYIRPVYDIGDNNNSVPFAANLAEESPTAKRALYDFDQKATEASVDFWTVYLLGAYQYIPSQDYDPDFEASLVAGIVDSTPGSDAQGDLIRDGWGALLFFEMEREGRNKRAEGHPVSEFALSPYWVPHEIAHLFGARHTDQGLMSQTSGSFSPKSLDRIRRTPHP